MAVSIPRPAPAPVVLHQVSKTYGSGEPALVNVTLTVEAGEFIFVTGPSGSGKSTLLKLLYGEEQATTGQVVVAGERLNALGGRGLARLRRRIGIIFQDYKLIPNRTVAENVAFALWPQGYTPQEIRRRLTPTLKMVGLLGKAHCFPEQLSGGEQQRVSIARAVVGTPPLLLADEPTGNLDPDNAQQILQILDRLNATGITVIVTTHDAQLVAAARKPVVHLRSGYLQRLAY